MTNNTHSLQERLNKVRGRIAEAAEKYGRQPDSIRLLAVSKTRSSGEISALASLGQHCFGESYIQEALDKITSLSHLALEWHFIGPVQSNKTRAIATHFDWVHSIDRAKIACRLNEQRPKELEPMNVCLQVNVSGEPTKSGVSPEQLPELARLVSELPQLRLRGLMAIPAKGYDFEAQRQPFRALRHMFESLMQEGIPLDTLSMGMSQDIEAAIAEGSTLVRVGTALFGPRRY